jgi:hypothetical protein
VKLYAVANDELELIQDDLSDQAIAESAAIEDMKTRGAKPGETYHYVTTGDAFSCAFTVTLAGYEVRPL